ncbi:hypothetical protein PF002_g26060 [Phytophthora fragariae]|uniref:Crinkler effector protein N-terminal domain-containing protein n=1 Tax=Phytophthora fragariae TaxID=53985 RepID=A0A6A3HZX6_9STRA|nr:hypothetical protein PF011_g24560 [Phytophthora fragariae]KAE9185818.1 hypothetical protein PF002_g26060 [Phytophthora fragariae]
MGDLKKAIKKEKKNMLKDIDADKLQLFLAKKDGAWLKDDDPAALELEEGKTHQDIQTCTEFINAINAREISNGSVAAAAISAADA